MTDTHPEPVRLVVADGVATITLARPQAGNAMNMPLVDALFAQVGAVVADKTVRAILLEGEGRNFCVGGDLRAFVAEADPAGFIGALARRLHQAMRLLHEQPVPVVIAVQGAAAGAGLGLAASGDIVLAARSASFTLAYGAIGLTADGGATWLLPRLIGLRRTQEMVYAGRRLDATEAAAMGLVTRVVEDADLATEARTVAAAIARGPTGAFGAVRGLLAAGDGTTLADQLDAEAASMQAAMAGADAQEGVAAFLERRPARFTGA
ncbi:enoyl-CoA hydratase/isomerase family protein [Sphingomonas solaris]|uniref:Enoyl-CoA hydratase n=1 Tax=Alterirhizorhabdus solaris TaxID=2529389 RepID=A0A558QTN8_9SPHN|nr:enoyl-CoA hydratase-related protein [Sphingomonas solaris]TVV70489.1 enoyl-CoA hydratase [Sphingomonas solaris]